MLVPSIFGENVLDNFFNDSWTRPGRELIGMATPRTTIMKTNVKETDQAYELDIELPGYKKEDINAELKDGNLTVSASAKTNDEEKDQNGRYIRRERYEGSCSRTFYVGDEVEGEDISAKFEDGILILTILKKQPKPEVEKNHVIKIA